ncbi:MAG: DUF4156 domain-containing protein [Gammaproteobacteria bacterium]
MAFNKRIGFWTSVLPLFLSGCALFFNDDAAIKLTGVQPDPERCRFIAQAVGQGGGDIVQTAAGLQNMREDAIDQIRQIARWRGGNTVFVVEAQNHNLSDYHEEIGTVIGQIYRCR